MAKLRFLCLPIFLGLGLPFAHAQQDAPPPTTYMPNLRVQVEDLPMVTAKSKDDSLVLLAAVETILHDQELCCNKDSALVDVVLSADPSSLKSVSAKLQGRQHLSDGRPILVAADYIGPSDINAGQIIGTLRQNHAMLMQWKSHIYVLYGAIYDAGLDSSGGMEFSIHKLLLIDPRYSDARRQTAFDRDTDDFARVRAMMTLTVKQP